MKIPNQIQEPNTLRVSSSVPASRNCKCSALESVELLPDASHWVHHDEPERVTQLLSDSFAPARPSQTPRTSTT
jgi:pimeloyl-ACP methyl ester carboxylesterase